MLGRTATTSLAVAQERRRPWGPGCSQQEGHRRRRARAPRATPADADAGAGADAVQTTTKAHQHQRPPAPATSLPSALRGATATTNSPPSPPPQRRLLPFVPTATTTVPPSYRRIPPARHTLRALLDGLEAADADALSFGPLLLDANDDEGGGVTFEGDDEGENGEAADEDDERWPRLLAIPPTTTPTTPMASDTTAAAATRAAAHLARLHPQLLHNPETLLRWRRFLDAFDLPPRTRARLLAAAPELVTRGCVHSTGKLLLFYRAWGWSDESLRSRIFAQWPRLLLSRVEEECHPVVEYARALGATDEGVATLLWEYPRITRPRGVTVGGGTGGLGGWAGWAGGGAGGDYKAQLRKFARLGMYGLRSGPAVAAGGGVSERTTCSAIFEEEEDDDEEDGGGVVSSR